MKQRSSEFAPVVTREMIDAGLRAARRERSLAFHAALAGAWRHLSRPFTSRAIPVADHSYGCGPSAGMASRA